MYLNSLSIIEKFDTKQCSMSQILSCNSGPSTAQEKKGSEQICPMEIFWTWGFLAGIEAVKLAHILHSLSTGASALGKLCRYMISLGHFNLFCTLRYKFLSGQLCLPNSPDS